MATRAQVQPEQNRFIKPLIPILVVLVIGSIFFFIGSAVAGAVSEDAAPFDFMSAIPYVMVAGAIAYGFAVAFGDAKLWQVGTREVVYMAVGAALYGVLSWATNIIQLPSISFVSLRPAVVIPIFFGIAFGPAVGFFSGFVGNVLGDALTGWGVFPVWCLGNGLMGMIPGLVWAFRDRKQALNVVLGIIALVAVGSMGLIFANPVIADTWDPTQTNDVSGMWWLPLVALAVVGGAFFLLRGREELAAAQVWGALGIIVGIGFAAIANMWTDGYGFAQTMLGQFVPAAASNLINVAILLPILMTAWAAARSRTGR